MSREPSHDSDALLAALLGLLPARLPGAPAAAALRARILDQAASGRPLVVRAEQGEWVPFLPGIRIKTLRRNESAGTQTSLWRLEPGSAVPPHPHKQEEECLVLEGSVVQDGVEYRAGDYLVAPAGGWHERFVAPRGALLMIRSELIPDARSLRGPRGSGV